MTCGNCGHSRGIHEWARPSEHVTIVLGRCCHVGCECPQFLTHEEAHKHCWQDVHNCAWLTPEEHAAPRQGSR